MIIRFNYDLSSHNTFRMKVSCGCFVEYDSVKELEGLQFDNLPQPVIHIGQGSNLLFTKDFPGTVLHSGIKYIKYIDLGLNEVSVMVGSGVIFDNFVQQVCEHGLWGAENLSAIPGEVGAAAVQNIGAYGAEVADIISGVVCYDLKEKKKIKFSKSECGYGYRHSFFKESANKGRYIVTSVLFRLIRKSQPKLEYKGLKEAITNPNPSPQEIREAIIQIRDEKLPNPSSIGSAGSFFKNPVVSAEEFDRINNPLCPNYPLSDGRVKLSAAWLIDSCGLKGATEGGAAVYDKQALVIVNSDGKASAEDVLRLENRIIQTVKEHYGVDLYPEVEHI